MKFRIQAYLILMLGILLTDCSKKNEAEERYTWSTDAPLTIPYKNRIQRLQKGNLIRNHSFENGRVFAIDSVTSSFVIDGWQQIGKNVEWTDIRNDSLYKPDDAYSGYRAVKITRKKAYETDQQGDGIITDFIKVIPGNYKLSFFTRLQNVKPNRSRLGTRMFDAIDISMLYFDRNKIPIIADHVFPQLDQVVNSSFKGLSLANYESIQSFGWGKIIGKTASFPYQEGDIPSDAHFIKIRITLKGTGTCYIDSVSLKYTDKNFSVAERMSAYTDTGFHAAVAITPTPKKMKMMEAIEFYDPKNGKDQLPVIVIPENNDPGALNAAKIIAGALQNIISKNSGSSDEIKIINKADKTSLKSSRLIISIGNTDYYKEYNSILPVNDIHDRPQGYFLYTPEEKQNLVIIDAHDQEGIFYAATTFAQLVDNKAAIYHNARIIDFPDFPKRFCTLFNGKYIPDNSNNFNFIGELKKYKLNGALFLVDQYDYKPNDDDNPLFQITTVSGYFRPDESTLTYNTIPEDQYPLNAKYIFPVVFNNQMMDISGINECCFHLPEGIKYIYTGSSFFSMNTDEADINRYISLIGTSPVFMDNSMLMYTKWGQYGGADKFYPGKMRLFNLFEPYGNSEIQQYFSYFDRELFVVNLTPHSETDVIRLATAADFMWNASSYSKDYSLWKVLTLRYGVANAREIIEYADTYGLLLEIVLKLELNIQVQRNIKAGQQTMAALTKQLSDINMRLGPQHKLVRELQLRNADLRNRLNQQIKKIPVKK